MALGLGLGIPIGLVIGIVMAWIILRGRAQTRTADLRIENVKLTEELNTERQKAASLDMLQERMKETFTSLAHQALTSNSQQLFTQSRDQLEALLKQVRGDWGTHKQELKGLVDPLNKALDAMDRQVRALEQKREGAYQSLGEHLRNLGEAQTRLQSTSTTLVQAMKSSTARGKWGELQLRRVVELAGMTKHVDFSEQASVDGGRPDMIVRLPNEGILPIDAKAPAAAYLEAMDLEGERRTQKLLEHAKAMRARIIELGRKAYMDQFEKAPEIVVMFVPFESALSAAFEQDPGLLEYGIEQRILIASPVTLLALLRAAAFGWQQYHIAEHAQKIADQGRELYTRFLNVLKPIADAGDKLGKSVDAYNKAIGSMESRLMPALRNLKDAVVASENPPELDPIEQNPRLPLDANE